jgi:hypothetical protein
MRTESKFDLSEASNVTALSICFLEQFLGIYQGFEVKEDALLLA